MVCSVKASKPMSSGAPMRPNSTDATLLAVIACWMLAGRNGLPLKIVNARSAAAPGGLGKSPALPVDVNSASPDMS